MLHILHYILNQMDQHDKIGMFPTKTRVNFLKNGNRHSAQDQMCYTFALHIEPNGPTGQNRGVSDEIQGQFSQNMGIGILRRIKCVTSLHYILRRMDQQDKIGAFQTKSMVNFQKTWESAFCAGSNALHICITLHIEPNGPT